MLVKEQEQWLPAWSRGTWSNLAPGLWQQQSSVSNVWFHRTLRDGVLQGGMAASREEGTMTPADLSSRRSRLRSQA